MFSFRSDVRLKDLQNLWTMDGESLRSLKKTLRILDGTMLKTSELHGEIYVGFHNPSVRDYFVHLISSDVAELVSLIKLVRYYEQFETLWLQFPVRGKGIMLPTYIECRRELEEAAAAVFRAVPFDAHSRRGAPVIDFARRAWVFLEMGRDIKSSVIRGMGLEAVAENKERMNAEDGVGDYNALLQVLAEDDTPEGRQAFMDAVDSAIEWALGDVSDWNLINEAEHVLYNVRHYAPGEQAEEALEALAVARFDFAKNAIDDWSQSFKEPISSAAEMKEIIDYYNAIEDPPYFDGFETAEERVYEIDWDHLSAFRGGRAERTDKPTWGAAREVEHMMRTLRNVE